MPLNPRMKHSKTVEQLTEGFEAKRLSAYIPRPGDVPTIGYGHTRGVKMGDVCTDEQAVAWLQEDYVICEKDVNDHVNIPLTQGEFDALVDFCFNLGGRSLNNSTLLRLLNAGEYKLAAHEFERWDMAGGKHMAGLLRRRLAEEALFNS
jgi:lysozyme